MARDRPIAFIEATAAAGPLIPGPNAGWAVRRIAHDRPGRAAHGVSCVRPLSSAAASGPHAKRARSARLPWQPWAALAPPEGRRAIVLVEGEVRAAG
jgi:hypothetical protein